MSARRPAGFTIIELIIAIAVASIVLGATWKLLTSNQRFYRSQSQIMDVQQNLRTVAQIVSADLRELDAKGGDLVTMGDTMITIRAMRGFGVVCKVSLVNGQIWLKKSLFYMSGSIDPTKDNVFVFREADTTKNSDDTWQQGTISAVTTDNCADGSAGTRLSITLANGNTKLDSVTVGAPVRIWELVHYGLWPDASNVWWLGTSTFQSGAWTATTPVAGPLAPNNGLVFAYYDSSGAVTGTAASVASIGVTVRGRSTQPIIVQGRPVGPYRDSMTVRATLRNN